MTTTVCLEPGCPNLAERGGRCAGCHAAYRQRSDRHRPSARERGYDGRWERTRRVYLRSHPTCEMDGCIVAATDVHHLDGQGPAGPRGHDWLNLQALCHAHHSQTTTQDQPGGWNAR